MEYEYRITTIDNPYDPFTEFDQWIMYDKTKGYNTSEYLARVVDSLGDSSDDVKNFRIKEAIDYIIEIDPINIYKKVRRSV